MNIIYEIDKLTEKQFTYIAMFQDKYDKDKNERDKYIELLLLRINYLDEIKDKLIKFFNLCPSCYSEIVINNKCISCNKKVIMEIK